MEHHKRVIDELITVRDYLRWCLSRFLEAGLFYGHGTDNPYDEARALVLRSVHLPLDSGEEILDARLTRAERQLIFERVETRVTTRTPLAYLLGEAWFAGLCFHIDERVIVPRSPFAELIDKGFQPWLTMPEGDFRILDMCTGSGCIGIACALAFEDAQVDLVDISADAIAVAELNIERFDCSDRVRALCGDGFQGLDGQRQYQLIVSNPPYVDAEDFADMPDEFRHEPELALASGFDGLDFCRQLLAEAGRFLSADGLLVVEVGNSAAALEQAFPQLPFTWLEFEHGGHGVFVLSAEELALL